MKDRTRLTGFLLAPLVVVSLLLAACRSTAAPTDATGPTATSVVVSTPTVALTPTATLDEMASVETSPLPTAPPPPTPTPSGGDLLVNAQQTLAAYLPVTDTQPVVSTLLSSIADWLDGGGDPAALALALTTTSDLAEAPATVTELDLTGDGRQDVVVRIPVMGLPLLIFVDNGSSPAHFVGCALPPDLEAIRTDFALEQTEIEKPAVQLEDLTGDDVPEVLFTTLFAGGSNYRLRPHAFQWHEGDFRLVFAADLVSWAGTSDYALEPDPMGKGRMQFILTYPHLYNHGFDHKMINHPAGQQTWRWSADAGRFVLFEESVDLEQSAWQPGLPLKTGDRLRWLTNEGEEVFRAGQYEEAVQRYEEVLRQAEADDRHQEEQEPDWRAYAAFRRAETLLLLGQASSGLPAIQAVATEMEGDLLGELARTFLQGYGDGSSPDAAARGVAAMQAVDLYPYFYYERAGALRFPMDADGILYPGAGLAAYLNAHPDGSTELAEVLARNPSALRAGLRAIGFAVEEVTLVEGGDLRITLRLPDVPYADGDLAPWLLTDDGGGWRVSLPISEGEWPAVGWFTP